MQKLVFFLALLTFGLSCKKDEKPPLPPNTIQIDGQDWAYSASCGLLRTAGNPSWSDIYVKIDGENGSALFLGYNIPNSNEDSELTRHGAVYYYLLPELNSPHYRTDVNHVGEIELLEIDSANKTISLRFRAILNQNGQKVEVASGMLQGIAYDTLSAVATYFSAAVEKNHQSWQFDEMGADMIGGQVNWFLHSKPNYGEQINFNIPWCAQTGVYQLTPADGNVIFFPEHSPLFSWKLKSGQMQLDEVDFCSGRMRGKFQAVFETYDNAAPPIEFNDVRFEVRYNFY